MKYYNSEYVKYYSQEDLERLENVLSSHVADALAHENIKNCVMNNYMTPLCKGHKVIGSACTMMAGKSRTENNKRGLKALVDDTSKPGDVIVIDVDGYMEHVMWGGRVTMRSMKKGIQGIFIDGSTRDIEEIQSMNFPVFAKGKGLNASEGKIECLGINIPIRCGGVIVKPGDIIVADDTGAVVIPKENAKRIIELNLV